MAGLAASFQDGLDRFLKGSEICPGDSLAGVRDCGTGLQEPGCAAAHVPGLLQGRSVSNILGDQYRAGAGEDQQDGKSQDHHEAPFLVSQRHIEVCPMIGGEVEGREDGGRLLDTSGVVGGPWGGRFQCTAGSMAVPYYSGRQSLHLDLLAADLIGVKTSCPRGRRTSMRVAPLTSRVLVGGVVSSSGGESV